MMSENIILCITLKEMKYDHCLEKKGCIISETIKQLLIKIGAILFLREKGLFILSIFQK